MKKSKIIVPALAMLVMSTAATVTGTVAWFSMNKTVSASGMNVTAAAEGSLVITAGALPVKGEKSTDVNLADPTALALYPSTHDDNYTNFTTGLKRCKTTELINPETGIVINEESVDNMDYEEANNTSKTFYKDYTVYIAGDGQAFANQSIKVSLSGLQNGGAVQNINKALSVDFYGMDATGVGSAFSSANYKGTLNLAGTKNKNDHEIEACTDFTMTGINIPMATATTGTAAYAVTMRVFFDGALLETGGNFGYTTYTDAPSGTVTAGAYYYSDDKGSAVLTTNTGDDIPEDSYIVDTSNSTKAYARSADVASIREVSIKATFEAA